MRSDRSRIRARWAGITLIVALGMMVALGALSRLQAADAPLVLKFACVAPEGSLWVNLTRDWDRELRARSSKRIRMQIFAGGILGEEIDAIRKMRAGQVQATGVTGVGMGEMVPATRGLELPRMFQSYAELDATEKALESYYVDAFSKRGYVFLGFTEVGPIHIFTKKPIRKIEELNANRMWVWEGDPVSEEIARTFKVSAVPLSLLNVLASLQTGVIDSVYGSPLAVVTMQWHNYLKYMLSEPLAYAIGVIVMDKKTYDAYPADIQKLMIELGRKYTRQMVERSRVDNAKAVELMKQKGVQATSLDPAELQKLGARSRQVWTNLQNKLYTPELLGQVESAVKSARAPAAGAQR